MVLMLVAMKGHPGSGKSTLARSLGRSLHWPVIDKDDVRDYMCPEVHRLDTGMITTNHNNHIHSNEHIDYIVCNHHEIKRKAVQYKNVDSLPCSSMALMNSLAYGIMWRMARTQLVDLGLNVIVDSPLSRPSLLASAMEIVEERSCRSSDLARLVVIECMARDATLWRTRLEARSYSSSLSWHKPQRWEDLQALLHAYDGCWDYPIDPSSCVRKLVVDTTSSDDVSGFTDSVLHWINNVSDETPAVSFVPRANSSLT